MTDYRLTPGTLAGMGDSHDALQPLMDAGWDVQTNALGNCRAWSNDGRLRVGFQPEYDPDIFLKDRNVWTVDAYRAAEDRHKVWMADFDEETPVELFTAFVDAARSAHPPRTGDHDRPRPARGAPASRHATPGAPTGRGDRPVAVQPLVAAGWDVQTTPDTAYARSRDGLVQIGFPVQAADDPARDVWAVEVFRVPGDRRCMWSAEFDQHTPPALVAVFLDATRAAHQSGLVRGYDDAYPPPSYILRGLRRFEPEH